MVNAMEPPAYQREVKQLQDGREDIANHYAIDIESSTQSPVNVLQAENILSKLDISAANQCFEIQDTKYRNHNKAATPSAYAPEVIAISSSELLPEVVPDSPSNAAPQVILSNEPWSGKMEVQEEKIIYNSDKILLSGGHKSSLDNKMLSPEQNTSATIPVKTSKWYTMKRYRIILLAVVVIILCLVGIGAWIGSQKSKHKIEAPHKSNFLRTTPSGMAATQWLDLDGIRHYRVYFQDRRNAILESAWDSNSTGWRVSEVANPDLKVQNQSSLGAAAGWPHANYSWTHVRPFIDPNSPH
jgi:hypothetical protein